MTVISSCQRNVSTIGIFLSYPEKCCVGSGSPDFLGVKQKLEWNVLL